MQVRPVFNRIRVPAAEQVARLERGTVRPHRVIDPHTPYRVTMERTTREVVYLVTSLYPETAGPGDLLALARRHWSIEALHHIQDVTYDEDRSTIRTGHGPANVAPLTRLAISLIRTRGFATVPDGPRYWRTHPTALLALVG